MLSKNQPVLCVRAVCLTVPAHSLSERRSAKVIPAAGRAGGAERAEKAAAQLVRAKQAAKPRSSAPKQGKLGRPKDGRNKDKRAIEWTAELQRIAHMAETLIIPTPSRTLLLL